MTDRATARRKWDALEEEERDAGRSPLAADALIRFVPSAGADAYEQVQDTAEALSRAMSGGVSAASKGSTAGSFGDALEGGSSDESSERRRRRKKKEKKSAEKSAKSSRKSKKAEKEEKPATESASKGKKKKKAVKDWDESDSD